MSIDEQKYEYFLAKYRALDHDELHELGAQTRDLIDEARLAYQEVCKTTGIEPKKAPAVVERIQTLTPEKLEEEKRRSSELWNGSLTKRVENLLLANVFIFFIVALGLNGMKLGALPLFVCGGIIIYSTKKMGRIYTRKICSNSEATIEQKTKKLEIIRNLLWPALLASFFLSAIVAAIIRRN